MKPTQYRNVAAELAALDAKINALLPPRYQHCYTSVSPNSMGSAGLKYGPDGRVAWDEIWTTFCDLALAGGPPHRGKLLEPVSEAEVAAEPERYGDVVAEIDRAIGLTTGLPVVDGYAPGWVGVQCGSLEEAAWLQFAVTAENVSARRRQSILQLPAGPAFRVEKEIKNVVVALAKAYHYWDGHLTAAQQSLAGEGVLGAGDSDRGGCNARPSTKRRWARWRTVCARPGCRRRRAGMLAGSASRRLARRTPCGCSRAVLVEQVLARREGTVLYLPVGATPNSDQAARVGRAFRRAWDLWTASSPRRPAWRPAGRARLTLRPGNPVNAEIVLEPVMRAP